MGSAEGIRKEDLVKMVDLRARDERDLEDMVDVGWSLALSHVQGCVQTTGYLLHVVVSWLASIIRYVDVGKHTMDMQACLLTCGYINKFCFIYLYVFIYLFIYSLIHLFTIFIHSFIYLFIHSFICLFTYWFIYLLIHLFIHLLLFLLFIQLFISSIYSFINLLIYL